LDKQGQEYNSIYVFVEVYLSFLFLPLFELLSVQCIELALEFHDLESDLALNVKLLILATILEQHIVCIQTLLDSRAGSLLVVIVINRSTSFFRILELKTMLL